MESRGRQPSWIVRHLDIRIVTYVPLDPLLVHMRGETCALSDLPCRLSVKT